MRWTLTWTEALHLKARGLMLSRVQGWPHLCSLGGVRGLPGEALGFLSAPGRPWPVLHLTQTYPDADVVPSGCLLEMLWFGRWLILLVGKVEVRCLNWQKCLVYIRRRGVKQMKTFISPFAIHLKHLAPGRLKSFPCSPSGLSASCCKTHDLARVEEGRFGCCASHFPAN